MNISQIEENVKSLVKKIDKGSFIYDMLLAYGTPKATITRAKNGSKNLSKNENEIVIKKKVFFAHFDKDIDQEFERLSKDSSTQKHDPRFVIVTDYKTIKALDTKLDDKLEFPIKDFNKKFDFFLPLAGIEKKEFKHENPVDVKAAEKLAKLFDIIKKDNPKSDPKSLHSLNVFLTRLLFCYFAEDTDIFSQGLFTDSVGSHTQVDGSDLSEYLAKIFEIMNLEKRPNNTPDYLSKFPYVNGGLFAEDHPVPKFTKKSREALLDIGDLNWAEINPDIFGSMIQAVVHPDQRAGLGMHYTSVSNIMKVIESLFLTDLYKEFDASKKSVIKLRNLLKKITSIKVFDPACGSGNFLIIAYKQLRILEMKILKQLNEFSLSGVSLRNFNGIEYDDFAHEVAILSLWLTAHQMDVLFKAEFGQVTPTLPLRESGNIVCGNSLSTDWNQVCEKGEANVYIIGNPPYLGGKLQSKKQKDDMALVFKGFSKYNNIDYIGAWFYKAALYLDEKTEVAFVTTNSINQGTQVYDLWPSILNKNIEISFAIKDFVWSNNAKDKAKVICSIIGLRKIVKKPKYLEESGYSKAVKNINAYLVDGPNIFVEKRTKPLCDLPKMIQGNIALDDGNLQLTRTEKDSLESKYPTVKDLIRPIVGSRELIQGGERYCLWIENKDLKLAESIPEINKRLIEVKKFRLKGATNAKSCADRPHSFCMLNTAKKTQIVLPRVSSVNRDYIPTGFFNENVIVSDAAQVILDADPVVFSILNSKMHIVWVRKFAGKLKNDFRYSAGICWYSFPFPKISESQREFLERAAYGILAAREKYSEMSLAEMYDREKMPDELKKAHDENDKLIESCYRKEPYISDSDRLADLLIYYKSLIKESDE